MQVSGLQSGLVGVAAPASKASGLFYYDPRDSNKDGMVSVAEQRAYLLDHPEAGTVQRANSATQNRSSGATSSAAKTSGFTYHDRRDTNQDGIVSPAENLAYSLRHPNPLNRTTLLNPAASSSGAAQYSQKGALNPQRGSGTSSFSLLA